jgi:DNA-directed RNA polymerase specialized sigma24 family protein
VAAGRRTTWCRGRSVPTADDDATWGLPRGAEAAQSHLEWAELLRALRRAVAEELTPRQRDVFVAVALNGVESTS